MVTETPRTEISVGDIPFEPSVAASEIPTAPQAKRSRSARKPATPQGSLVAEATPVAAVTGGGDESAATPKPKRAARKAAVHEIAPVDGPNQAMTIGEEAVAPKRKRPARKKKAEAPAGDLGDIS
jgi:pyruvate/2-oxoglutarate dehydrogenase complex dihydrolipoamide acyltransferase (E2) component